MTDILLYAIIGLPILSFVAFVSSTNRAKREWIAVALVFGVLPCQCSSTGDFDGGLDGATDGMDGAGGDDQTGGSFLVHVPQDAALCSHFGPMRSLEDESAVRGRVRLRPGDLELPREAGSFEGSLVDSILFGPSRTRPTPRTPAGIFEAAFEIEDGQERWVYTFRQLFDLGGAVYSLEITLPIDRQPAGWPGEVTLDPDFMTFRVAGRAVIGPGELPTEYQNFCPCRLSGGGRAYDLEFSNGDRLHLEQAYASEPPEFCAGCTILFLSTRAEVTIGTTTVVVDDPLRLVYAASIHNLNPNFLVELPAPLGSVAAVTIDNEPCYGGTCRTLDATGATLDQLVTSACTESAIP